MNRKEYLLDLINKRDDDLGEVKDKIVNGIDTFSDGRVERLITIFERSTKRRERIKAGEAKEVLNEMQMERATKRAEEKKEELEKMKTAELRGQAEDKEELSKLIDELEEVIS